MDTRRKNLAVTRAIVETITERPASAFDALRSQADYDAALARTVNWRAFYARAFGMTEPQVDRAGALWGEYQLQDQTETPAFPGIAEALEALTHLPHGIVSQNGRSNIWTILETTNLAHHFSAVIGYEEVDLKRQKPAPEGLLQCLEALTHLEPGYVFYIGDHATDALCAAEARAVLAERKVKVEVVSVGAFYGVAPQDTWAVTPDHVARRPADIVGIIHRYTASPPKHDT